MEVLPLFSAVAAPITMGGGGGRMLNGHPCPRRILVAVVLLVCCSTVAIIASSSPFGHENIKRQRHLRDPMITPSPSPSRSSALQYFLLAALSISIVVHIGLLLLIAKYRESPTVKAAQPVGQALIVAAGASALVGGICLVVPSSDVTCSLTEPLIFTSVTIVGASLAGMVWRVERVVSPVLKLGRRGSLAKERVETTFGKIKGTHSDLLTLLASQKSLCRRMSGNPTQIQQQITNACLMRVILCLSLPQLVLQVLNLTLPSLKSHLSPMLVDACTRPSESWQVVLGTVLTILPFISAALTTSNASGHVSIPTVLCERSAIRSIFFYFTFTAFTVAPILAFSETGPNLSTYISIYLLFGAVIPVTSFVVLPKLRPIIFHWMEAADINIADRIMASAHRHVDKDNNARRQEKAMDALDQGQVFEEMDLPNNSIKLYSEALELWQNSNGSFVARQFSGDYTSVEIHGIVSPTDADLIVSLLTCKARYYEQKYVLKAAKCYLKAIEVIEFSPAGESMMDRSTVYPCFHGIFRLLREGKFQRDFVFEKALAGRFVQETDRSQSSIHRACALAVSAQMKFRSGLTREALEELDRMNTIYSVNDAKSIREASGVDVCFLTCSMGAIWYTELGEEKNAIKQCEKVIKMLEEFPPSEDPTEMHAVLIPVIVVLRKKQPTRVKWLYEEHVMKHVTVEMPLCVRNMDTVLSHGRPELKKDVSWILSKENLECQIALDFLNVSLGLSANTVAAEACLLLAQRGDVLGHGDNHVAPHSGSSHSLLLNKGLAFATIASMSMRENDHLIASIADDKNRSILSALQELARKSGHIADRGAQIKRVTTRCQNVQASRSLFQLKAKKTLPHHLLLSHDTAAFVGLTHDSLSRVFTKALSEEPRRTWEGIYIFYVSDELIKHFAKWEEGDSKDGGVDQTRDLCEKKETSQIELYNLLSEKTEELRFYEISGHCSFFGSFFGWREPGGYIHSSPSIWGVDVKTCPSQSFTWEADCQPSSEYNAYKRGIENLLSPASPFATQLDPSQFAQQLNEFIPTNENDQPGKAADPKNEQGLTPILEGDPVVNRDEHEYYGSIRRLLRKCSIEDPDSME